MLYNKKSSFTIQSEQKEMMKRPNLMRISTSNQYNKVLMVSSSSDSSDDDNS